MKRVRLQSLNDFAEWRVAARALLLAGTHPEDVVWEDPAAGVDLFAEAEDRPANIETRAVGVVPPQFIELADAAISHRESIRFGLLYRLLFRLQKDRALIEVRSDPDISKLYRLAGEVRRDSHKMKGVRAFREDEQRFAAWFEPDHYTLERTAAVLRATVRVDAWAILTPYRSAAWDGEKLLFGEGARRQDVPRSDAMEETWRTYFASIFNPARVKVQMMKSEMPVKYWRNLPEAELIPSLIRGAKQAEEEMVARAATTPPARHLRAEARKVDADERSEITSLAAARAAVQGCQRCPLHQYATQAVFGEGPEMAEVMFVGEQPGDQEDLSGKPFVGPAGQVFDRALETVGIDRRRVYVTNAVKHFKFEPRGKKRIHQKPNAGEITACRFWVDLERELVRPKLIVALGATAAQSPLGQGDTNFVAPGPETGIAGRRIAAGDGPSVLSAQTARPGQAAEELRLFEDDLRAVKAFIDRRGEEVRRGGPVAA